MAGTKRERKLRRIERREQRMAAKVLTALAGLGDTREKAPCEEDPYYTGKFNTGDHGHLGICVHCKHKLPNGDGCRLFVVLWEDLPLNSVNPGFRQKNWEFDKWKQRTRKQKRSCVA